MDFPMVTTLISKNKLKTFNFANNLSKVTSFLTDIEKPPDSHESPGNRPVIKRAREANDGDEPDTGKKRCLEQKPETKTVPDPGNKLLNISKRKKFAANFE